MPPKIKVTREEILQAALNLVRQKGESALNARALAKELRCSTQPVFSNYGSMEEVKRQTICSAEQLYHRYMELGVAEGRYPPYKASGMAYIRFAKEEKQLFRLLFMRDRSEEKPQEDQQLMEKMIEMIHAATGLNRESAYRFQVEMWVCVHGIASTIATSYLEWDEEIVSNILTDIFLGLKARYQLEYHSLEEEEK